MQLLSKHYHVHWFYVKNERFEQRVSVSLIRKSMYIICLHSYNKKDSNIFDSFKFKRDFFSRDIRDQKISEYKWSRIHCHQKARFRSYCAHSC